MKLDLRSTLAGVPLREVRDFLRRYHHNAWSGALLRDRLNLTAADAHTLTEALMAEDLIAPAEGLLPPPVDDTGEPGDRWQTTTRGNALAAARSRRVGRAAAERQLQDLLARVEEVNRDGRWLYRVRRVILFGSLLDPAADTVGDVDLAIDLVWRGGERGFHGAPIQDYFARARREGRRFRSFLDQLTAPEEDVRKYLKGGSRVPSFHPLADLDALGGEGWADLRHRLVYQSDDPA